MAVYMKSKKTLLNVAKVVMRKSTTYLKICVILFVFSMLILSAGVILSWNQYEQIQSNFVENVNTHVIEVTGRYEDGILQNEKYEDVEEIRELLSSKYPSGDFLVFPMYQFSYGLDTLETDEPINIFAVDPEAQDYVLKDAVMEDGTLYTTKALDEDSCTIFVPKVKVSDKGINLSDEKGYRLKTSDVELNDIFDTYDSLGMDPFFVSYNTYAELFEYSFGEKLDSASIQRYTGVKLICKVYVYVFDINDVEHMARKIDKDGYITNFVFQSFDNLGEELGASMIIMLCVAFMLMVFTLISLFVSLKSYVQLISKDIGILKQMGYTSNEVYQIYSLNLKRLFRSISLIATLLVSLITIAILGFTEWRYIVIHLVSMNLLLIVVYSLSKVFLLKKKCNQDVITLLKFNKAFE